MKNYTRIAHAKEMVNSPGETRPKNTILLWWDDPGWMLGAHPASPSQLGKGENTMKCSWDDAGTGRDHSAVTAMCKTDSAWGN